MAESDRALSALGASPRHDDRSIGQIVASIEQLVPADDVLAPATLDECRDASHKVRVKLLDIGETLGAHSLLTIGTVAPTFLVPHTRACQSSGGQQ